MSKRVLICDDEPCITESLKYLVKREGYEPITAQDGEEGLAKAREMLPGLLLLDVMMPKKTGFEVCRCLKEDERTKGIHIIILTALGEDVDHKKVEEVLADDYITKPFSLRELSTKMHAILG